MKTSFEIREGFLKFFEEKHNSTRVKSSSLVPDNPTILLTTAGMVQFVPYFLGLEKAPYSPPRATTCQKCARAGGKDSDIENVGRTPRHHTFFEMLGNFSFGDYFKAEIIPWAWEFVTSKEYLGLEKDRLWITVFETDDEAAEIWEKTGVPKERIRRKGKKDNFWGPPGPSGPCGPCSEIHYDLGEHLKCTDADCSIDTCECDRWVEIWNLVFMEMFQDEKGNFSPLEKKNVDTGMGLERITMVCQNLTSTFETDLLKPILNKVCEITNKEYGKDAKTDISLRIITDHARCVSFMISDGITPSNEGRGYVLRMILRRALRHGYILGLDLPFLKPIIDLVINHYESAYPELKANSTKIKETILQEEERFKLTLQRGYTLIDEVISAAQKSGEKVISGENAFKLYDTYGFPLELTKEIVLEKGLDVDEAAFKALMEAQRERARASQQKVVLTDDLNYTDKPATNFVGYDKYSIPATVLSIIKDSNEVESTTEDDISDVILDTTAFYAESGGQIGDTGAIERKNGSKLEVLKTFKVGKVFVHRVKGAINVKEAVIARIDREKRLETENHHTLAHLLQAALIATLGDEVKQAGSQVENKRTRYDFSFPRALKQEEIAAVEKLINEWISKGLVGKIEEMSIEDAKKAGAMALFGEKYGNTVRVVTFMDGEKAVSMELCGGCHVSNTNNLRLAKIVSESAIAAGSRRIEILCSDAAFNYLNEKANEIDRLGQKYKIPYDKLEEKIEKLLEDNKVLSSKIGQLEADMASSKFATMLSKAQDVNGGKLFITMVEDFEPNAIKAGLEILTEKLGEAIIVLCSKKSDNTGSVVSKVSESFVKKGISAGKIVGEITKACGGNGGGKPQMAQGGAKDCSNLSEILNKIEEEIKAQLA